MMERFEHEVAVFSAARRLPAGERAAYLDQTCAGDAALRQHVEGLLRASEEAERFLQDTALAAQRPAGALTATDLPQNASAPGERSGDRIGRYKLLQQIGEGGCGMVYMAEQEEPVRRRVALKVIKLGMDTKQVVARFEAERQALALMDHPNIAKVLEAGATDTGRPYFVMELVRGIKITQYCDENNLSTEERLALFIKVSQAVQHAHQKGIIHRDIKPSNILVADHDGVAVPKIIDFGIAKATTDQRLTNKTLFTAFEQFIGTPAYMSPEQARMSGLDIDTRTDIYSLGVLLYELLTGKTPFDTQALLAAGLDEMRRTISEKEPARPSTRLGTMLEGELTTTAKHRRTDAPKLVHLLRGDLDWIVMKCLEKDRNRRYDTASGLASDLQRHLKNEPVVARPPSNLYRFQKMVRRNKLAFAAVAGIAMALVLGVAVSTWQAVRARRAEREQNVLTADAEKARQNEARLRQTAQIEARRAEAAAMELKMSLSTSDFLQGLRFIADGNGDNGLAFLVRSLSANPTNDAAVARLTSWLTYHPWMAPTLIFKHGHQVGSAEFSPDGQRIVTASYDKTARIWDAHTGEQVTKTMKHSEGVSAAHFSPDGKRIVTASWDGTARLWDAQTGEALTEPMSQGSNAVSAHFSLDGKRIVTASWENTARVWDAQTGQPLAEPMTHGGVVNSAQFSPDGKRIATASEDKTARVWDAQTGQPVGEPLRHRGPVKSAEFSPDGKKIVTASEDNTARVWSALTGQPLVKPMTHGSKVVSAQFSPDGKQIVTASSDWTARVWDAETGQSLIDPLKHGREMRSAQFSPEGKRIVTISFDRTVRIWDARTGQPLGEPMRHRYTPSSAQFSPDGRRLVTTAADQMTPQVWDVQSGQAVAEPMRHGSNVLSAQFRFDGKRIVTASADGTVRVWNADTGQPVTAPINLGTNAQAQFSPEGKRIVTASWDNTARVWDAQTGLPLTGPMTHGSNVFSAQFSPDGKRIVTASWDKTARVWDSRTGQQLNEMLHNNPVSSAQFSPDGKKIVTVWWGNTARVWDAQTGQPLFEMAHGNAVWSAQFSPDGRQIVTTSYDGGARLWDAQTGQQLAAPFQHGSFPVRSAQFSPDGKRLLTASDDRTARLWDVQTGERLAEVAHNSGVFSAQFSPDGKRILTASDDRTARLWDAETGQPLAEPLKQDGAWSSGLQFSPDGKRILSFADNAARIWDVAPAQGNYPDWLLPLTEAISGQVLNQQGLLEPTKLNRAEIIDEIRQRLNKETGDDDWVIWGRWLLADRATRTISPFSKVTVPEYIENQIKEKTPESDDGQNRKGP